MAVVEVQFDLSPSTSQDFETGFTAKLANGSNHRFTDSEFRQVHSMLSRWSTSGIQESTILDNFNRWYSIFPDTEMPADLKSYVFITRPEMNLVNGISYGTNDKGGISADNYTDTRLQYLAAMNPEIMYMLSKSYSDEHDFIQYLQGRTESLQLPDYQIRTQDFAIPFYNYRYGYPTVANESITGGTFDITFREDNELRITKMFQFWVYYMDAIVKNKMKPDRDHIYKNFYDFMCSVYEFICDPTSKRILFWAKYTGCFPTGVPLSNFSHNLRSNVDNKLAITFQYIMVEAMEPRALTDFNVNTAYHGNRISPIYNSTYGVIGDSLVGCPVVSLTPDEHGIMLNWTPMVTNGTASTVTKTTPVLRNIYQAIQNANAYVQQQNQQPTWQQQKVQNILNQRYEMYYSDAIY